MNARAVDDAAAHLRRLHTEQWEDLSLAVLVFGFALTATRLQPPLAVPLFIGGFAVWALGLRALWRHWDLLDRLADERDAYGISEVLAFACREATPSRRHDRAAFIRARLTEPIDERLGPVVGSWTRWLQIWTTMTSCSTPPARLPVCDW
jgi:hypothetical protein